MEGDCVIQIDDYYGEELKWRPERTIRSYFRDVVSMAAEMFLGWSADEDSDDIVW